MGGSGNTGPQPLAMVRRFSQVSRSPFGPAARLCDGRTDETRGREPAALGDGALQDHAARGADTARAIRAARVRAGRARV
jgi:hypothetical protein